MRIHSLREHLERPDSSPELAETKDREPEQKCTRRASRPSDQSAATAGNHADFAEYAEHTFVDRPESPLGPHADLVRTENEGEHYSCPSHPWHVHPRRVR